MDAQVCALGQRLVVFGGVVRSCSTISRSTIFTQVSTIIPEDSLLPLLKAILHSISWVRKTDSFFAKKQLAVNRPLLSANLSPRTEDDTQSSTERDIADVQTALQT